MYSIRYVGNYVLTACSEILLGVDVIGAIYNSIQPWTSNASSDDDTCRSIKHLSGLLSQACLNLHYSGRLHQYDSTDPFPPFPPILSPTLRPTPSCQPHDNIKPCSELQLFTFASLQVMKAEILLSGFMNSSCKHFFETAFSYCLQPDGHLPSTRRLVYEDCTFGGDVSASGVDHNKNSIAIGAPLKL